jgi:MerR family transcriptional regulator, heat shock protein HspR
MFGSDTAHKTKPRDVSLLGTSDRNEKMTNEYYVRKQVVEIFGFEETFLDELEAEDLVRSSGSEASPERVYPVDQVERLRLIATLVRELEVNLPGVEVILEMRENMIRMQHQFDTILEVLVRELKHRIG